MFRTATETLLELAADPRYLGATPAITAVLHTWTRDLKYHPHLHCIVSGGGLNVSGAWIDGRNPRFLFPVRVLGALFRGKYLDALYRAHAAGELRFVRDDLDLLAKHRAALYEQRWVVYAKRPFGGAEQVYEYLGRYTHRVGISNSRLRSLNADDTVSFVTKHNDVVTLPVPVFLHRFLQHTLPDHFVKIRHYGLLAPSSVPTKLAIARAAIAGRTPSRRVTPLPVSWSSLLLALVGSHATKCLRCGVDAVERAPLHSAELPPARTDTS